MILTIFSQFGEDCKSHQLSLPLQLPHKPQIVSIPGISPRERNRYRVVADGQILSDKLTLDEALSFMKRGEI